MKRRWAMLVAVAAVATALAHPIHTSFAEAGYNRAAKKLEVSLRVFADDFEAALGALAGGKISLEKTPAKEIDLLARAYLTAHFIVRGRDGTLASPRWIGRETRDAGSEVWLHFEIDLPAGVAGARIHHTALRERFSDQLNSVRVRDGTREVTLVFPPRQGERTVQFPP